MSQPFHPVIRMPEVYEVCDFGAGYDPARVPAHPYSVGKYNEKRPGMYKEEIFTNKAVRDIHVGIDIGCPVGTPVHSFAAGEVFLFAYNAAPGDYGYTLITLHELMGRPVYALHGHLSARSVEGKSTGQKIQSGEIIAWVGDRHENGGWNPHLHFQLSWKKPEACDMPGVVSDASLKAALETYPDPRLVLGAIY